MAGTGSEDVTFDVAAAETLESQCRSAACQVESLHSSRTGWVATAKTDFSGYFSTVFSDNADIETTDASNLAACLRGVADAVRFLTTGPRRRTPSARRPGTGTSAAPTRTPST